MSVTNILHTYLWKHPNSWLSQIPILRSLIDAVQPISSRFSECLYNISWLVSFSYGWLVVSNRVVFCFVETDVKVFIRLVMFHLTNTLFGREEYCNSATNISVAFCYYLQLVVNQIIWCIQKPHNCNIHLIIMYSNNVTGIFKNIIVKVNNPLYFILFIYSLRSISYKKSSVHSTVQLHKHQYSSQS